MALIAPQSTHATQGFEGQKSHGEDCRLQGVIQQGPFLTYAPKLLDACLVNLLAKYLGKMAKAPFQKSHHRHAVAQVSHHLCVKLGISTQWDWVVCGAGRGDEGSAFLTIWKHKKKMCECQKQKQLKSRWGGTGQGW